MTLQLGTAGSRAKIIHGANAEVRYGGVSSSEYMDVVNIDRFDAILGTKFMRKHAIALDFESNKIRQAGKDLLTLSAETEHAAEQPKDPPQRSRAACVEEVEDEETFAFLERTYLPVDGQRTLVQETETEPRPPEVDPTPAPEIILEFSRHYHPGQHGNTPNSQRARTAMASESAPAPGPPTRATQDQGPKLQPGVIEKMSTIFKQAAELQLAELAAGGKALDEADIPRLRERWMEISADIMSGVPEKMPPTRAVNHRIPLIDESMVYHYHLPRCPDAMKPQLLEKINKYVRAGWWEPVQTSQAAPMLCIPKKTGKLRTVIDARKRNDNTYKDVTPFPEQEQIRADCARAKHRSKIDMSDAYEQIRMEADDVWKTAFATVFGTFVSHTMQIGDCNAPATFQRIMTMVFQEFIGRFVHVYLNDIFVFSDSVEEHEEHLGKVFDTLRANEFYLKREKVDLYAEHLECLGAIIDDQGIHADADKMHRIREWRTPRNYNDVQRFLGLIQYLAPFLPDVTAFTSPLAGMCRNGASFLWNPIHDSPLAGMCHNGASFLWNPMHDSCFETIKAICCRTPVLKPIDPRNDEPIWVICDASVSGVGAMYGQGPTWQTCRPAGFMSRKFTNAQHNYRVFEQETLAVLEALLKWEDKLMGYRFHVVTDHKSLEFFHTQRNLSPRQVRWMEYVSRFDFDITYIKGELNKAADALSWYYENNTWDERQPQQDYASADVRLDKDLDDIPWDRREELAAIDENGEGPRRSSRLKEARRATNAEEPRDREAAEMEAAAEGPAPREEGTSVDADDPTIFASRARNAGDATAPARSDDWERTIRAGYEDDVFFKKVMEKPTEYPAFWVDNGIIYMKNRGGESVVCIPKAKLGEKLLRGAIIEQAHAVLGHLGPQRTGDYLRRWYWWPKISEEVRLFCDSCMTCQTTKKDSRKPAGKLHTLLIPERPWQSIAMDFVGPFPKSGQYDYLWVVICRLTSMVHLIPVHTRMRASELARVYVREIVRLHGLPESIVSDRDPKFTSAFWREVHRILGAKLLMSTAFHPQTDGATERANRTIAQILRAMISPDQKDWEGALPMTEFAINASVRAATGYSPFDLNCGYTPSMIREIRHRRVPKGIRDFVEQALLNLAEAHDAIIAARVFSTFQANKHRRDEPVIPEGTLVYLSAKNLSLPKARAKKLLPTFVGPYRVQKAFPDTSNYQLELPALLVDRGVHNRFHVSLLRPYVASSDELFPGRELPNPYDFGAPAPDEEHVDAIIDHMWLSTNR
uniref:RNA-directed DNA polymerase n=1 Tax=Mycena chlorophos TaxID=658473 RepID=A0ABQ0LYB1_MYCCL|nr:predicted protein [Mycena chlorophos]